MVENLIVQRVTFENGGLFEFININHMVVKNMQFIDCNLDENVSRIITFIQIVKLEMTTITITGNTYTGTNPSVFIHSGGIEDTNISTITFSNNVLFSLLDCRNFYDYNKKTITLTKDISYIHQGTFSGNTMINSIIDFIGF